MKLLASFLIFLALLFALRLLLLRCRSGHPMFETLRQFRYAHRGLHDLTAGTPENSLAAFRRAIERGYGAELDVHLLADGTLAVFHDSALQRMTGCEGVIENLTAADLGAYYLASSDQTIPLFSDVLDLFEGTGLPLIVELKTYQKNHAALAEATVKMLERYHVPYCLESFDPFCIMWLRQNCSELVRGQLSADFCHDPNSTLSKPLAFAATQLMFNIRAVPDFIAYHFADRHISAPRLCRAIYGAQLVYWTIRTPEELREAEREGAIVIFENFDPADIHS